MAELPDDLTKALLSLDDETFAALYREVAGKRGGAQEDQYEERPTGERELTDEELRQRLLDIWHARVEPGLAARSIEWLEEKWGKPPPACPMCRTNSWEVSDRLVEQGTWGTRGVRPALAVICNNCGNTIYLDAERAGFVRPEKPEPHE